MGKTVATRREFESANEKKRRESVPTIALLTRGWSHGILA
jgi:hypothetical protein